jgi:hypothetical protein
MAIASEIHSLEEINYKGRIRPILMGLICFWLLIFSFLTYYPFGEKLKDQIKKMTAGNCAIDYSDIGMELLPLPKLVIQDLIIPSSCTGREGAPLRLDFVNLSFRLISFSPLGIPFKLETRYNNQPIELFYVVGLSGQTIRMKDQRLVLSRLEGLMGNFKLGGSVTVDVLMQMDFKQNLTALDIKAQSNDFKIPAQTVMQNFNLPTLSVRKFYLETTSENFPALRVSKFILGDPDSPVRMDLKGRVNVREPFAFSPIKLDGELAFSEQFKQQFPVTFIVNESYTVKDGFYQVTLGGTVGAPQLMPR